MKKIFRILSLLAASSFVLSACDLVSIDCDYDSGTSGTSEPGIPCDFEGTVEMEDFTWTSSSDLGVYCLSDGAIVKNQRCKIDGWGYEPPKSKESEEGTWKPSKYEGLPYAIFHSVKNFNIPKGMNEYLVCAPYTSELIYVPGERTIYDLSISNAQTQSKAGVKNTPLSLGIAKGSTSDATVGFSLTPISAIIRISLSSTEFEGYYLSKISVSSDDAPLSGSMDYAIDSKETSITSSYSYINLGITTPKPLSKTEAQVFYINALPGIHTEDMTVTFTLSTATSTVSLPVAFKATNLVAGQITDLTYTDLKSSDNKVGAWFCPVESRNLVSPGYAYGQANTFFIQCKSAVYNGATLTPNPDIPEEVVIDYRLRGDYTKAEKPEGVTFEWLTKNGSTIVTPREDGKFSASKYTFTVDETNYKVTVKNTGATGGAPILVMKKDGKILWGWTFWNVAADGTTIEPITIGGIEMINMAIGQLTTKPEFISGNAGGHLIRTICYYQFGRYLPVYWDSYTSVYWAHNVAGQKTITGNGNMYSINGPFNTIEESLEYPAGLVIHNGTDNMLNWCVVNRPDLWGCEVGSPNVAGTKTQFDPCPKGWRVPDASTSDVLVANEAGYNNNAGYRGLYSGSNESIYYNFLFTGEFDGRKIGTNGRITGYGTGGNWSASWPQYYWTNYAASTTATTATAFAYWAYNAAKTPASETRSHQMATAAPIRCQRDKYNR